MNETTEQNQSSRVFIVDDHPLFREGLRQLIDQEPGLCVCGEAAEIPEALRLIQESKPDLVIVDISLGAATGIDLIKSLKADHPELALLVISMHDESLYAERVLRAGAMGYVMKHEMPRTVKTAIHRVLGGQIYLSEQMAASVITKLMLGGPKEQESPVSRLSDRELEVFRLLGQGKGRRVIAKELNLTRTTINNFSARIKEKLSLKDSSELLLHAIRWVQEQSQK
jgi:DNA-binding NarL/FixJ family response regulator